MQHKLTSFQITAKRILDGRLPYVWRAPVGRKMPKKFAGLVLSDDYPGFVALWVMGRGAIQVDACYSAYVESIYWRSTTFDVDSRPVEHDEVIRQLSAFVQLVQESVASPSTKSFALHHTVPLHVARSVLANLEEDPAQSNAYQVDFAEGSPPGVH